MHSEFQVGNRSPQDLASELERAGKILAACQSHADALSTHGWIAEDTAALADAIDTLDGGETDQEAAKDRKKGFTHARNLAVNSRYKMCLSIQNAARLAYPGTKAVNDAAILEARNRYLFEEFPPRGGASAGDKPPEPVPPPSPVTPPAV